MRIVSLVPSITESLIDLGLTAKELVGRTKFCIHPKEILKDVEIVGGTKNLNIKKIISLNPDIIIANKEENVKEQIETLQTYCKVWTTNIQTIEDNYYLIKQLGILSNQKERAQRFYLKTYEVLQVQKSEYPLKVAYLIWKNPYMSVGGDTFISNVLEELGFINIFKNQKRYPIVSLEDLKQADLIFLSSEPYPFKEKHISEIQDVCMHQKIFVVDGEAFSWYGTHIAKCGPYYQELLEKLSL